MSSSPQPTHGRRVDHGLREAGIRWVNAHLVLVWLTDPTEPHRRYVVEIFGDGESLGFHRAETFVAELYDRGYGDGCYGVYLALDPKHQIDRLEVTVCNEDRLIAAASRDPETQSRSADLIELGSVFWRGGLRLSGGR